MSLEEKIDKLTVALAPLPMLIAQNQEMKEEIKSLKKMLDKPLNIAECCELLDCSRNTFWKLRHKLRIAGGTPRHPLYWKHEVLSLKS